MAIQRRPLGDLQAGEAITPSASPTSTYYRPNIAQPDLAPLVDLSPLSKTVERYVLTQQAREAEHGRVAAEALFADPEKQATALGLQAPIAGTPEQQAKILRKRFHDLAERGEVPEAAVPGFQIRFAELAAQKTVAAYRDRLMSRVSEASRLVDPATGLPSQSADVQSIKDEAWQDLAGNPAIVNFYGSRVASPEKLRIDEEFDHAVARVRGQEMEREARTLEINQVAGELAALAQGGGSVEELSAALQERLGTTYVRPRELVLQAAQLAAQRMAHGTPDAPGDPDEALRFLDQVAGEVKVDGLTLGEDAEAADQLDRLKAAYERESEDSDAKEVRRLAARDALTAQSVKDKYLSPMMDALRAGRSVAEVEQAAALELEQLPDEERGHAFQALKELRASVESDRTSEPDVVRQAQVLMAQGAFEDASTLITAGLSDGSLSAPDVLALQGQIERRTRDRDVLEGNRIYREGLGVLERAQNSLGGFTGDVGREAADLFESVLLEYNEAAEGAVDANGVVDDEKLRAAAKAARERVTTFSAERDRQRQAVISEVRENAARLLGSSDLLRQAVAEGSITLEERDELRRISVQAADQRRSLLERSREGVAVGVLQSKAILESPEMLDADGRPSGGALVVVEAQEREMQDRMSEWLDANAKDIPAEQLQDRYEAALRRTRDEVLSSFRELSPEQLRNRYGLSKAGAAKQTAAGRSAQLRAEGAQVVARARDGATEILDPSQKVVGVPETVYRTYAAARQGRVTSEDAALALHRAAVDNPDPAARLEIARLGLLRPEHILAGGTQRIFATPKVRADAEIRLRGFLGEKTPKRPTTPQREEALGLTQLADSDYLKRVKLLLTPVEVDLTDATIDPWTTPLFENREELRAFGDGPDLPKLLSRLGLEEKDAGDWLGQQLMLIPR